MSVRLYHPELDTSIEASESAARVHERKGWIREDSDAPTFDSSTDLSASKSEQAEGLSDEPSDEGEES